MDYLPLGQWSFPNPPLPSVYTCENQGITVGWMDGYQQAVDCQWLDVTDVPAGDYTMRFHANPGRTFEELDYSNNVVLFPISLPAFGALPTEPFDARVVYPPLPPPPSNDYCSGARELFVDGEVVAQNTLSATGIDGIDEFLPGTVEPPDDAFEALRTSANSKTVWFKVQGTGGPLIVSTAHMYTTNFDTVLFVFAGACPRRDNETLVTMNDSGESVGATSIARWNTQRGVMYYVLVTGWEEFGGCEFGLVAISAYKETSEKNSSAPEQPCATTATAAPLIAPPSLPSAPLKSPVPMSSSSLNSASAITRRPRFEFLLVIATAAVLCRA